MNAIPYNILRSCVAKLQRRVGQLILEGLDWTYITITQTANRAIDRADQEREGFLALGGAGFAAVWVSLQPIDIPRSNLTMLQWTSAWDD